MRSKGRVNRKSRLTVVILACVPPVLLANCGGCSGADLNHAAAFGWRKFADTDASFAEFTGGNYTIAARFMLQYPYAYTGPLLAASGGGFELSKLNDAPKMQLKVGSITATYSLVTLTAKEWHHVAVVCLNSQYYVYLDGTVTCPDGFGGCSLPTQGGMGTGILRLGRPGSAPISGSVESQFFGFVDDVAVFDAALGQSDIQALASADRLVGTEGSLLAGWTFDDKTPSGGGLPAKLKRPISWRNGTSTSSTISPYPHGAIVSEHRDDATDASLLPVPHHSEKLTLPFPKGEAWLVGQGWEDTNSSHHGRGAFCWDFWLAGQPQSATNGKPFYAAAPGIVKETNDGAACNTGLANYVMIEQAPGEIGAYLHAVSGSLQVAKDDPVATGAYLANAGDTGNACCGCFHLHFSLHNLPESMKGTLVTIPAAFSDYEVSKDGGVNWTNVTLGIPVKDDWVRNPN
jgi:Concanavalin A-like lectin/glucanases superfamily/Peptidase family M23